MKKMAAWTAMVILVALTLVAYGARYEDLNVTKLRLSGTAITATAAEINNAADGMTATPAELNELDASADTGAAYSNGTVNATVATVVETQIGFMHRSAITLGVADANPAELADGADGEGTNTYTFPAGVIKIHAVFVDGLVCTNEGNFNASDDDHYYLSIGTTEAASGDDDLTALEQNLMAKTDLDTAAGVTVSHTSNGFLAAPLSIDGTTTACGVFLNNSVEASDNSAANQTGFTAGTITIYWTCLGDY